MSFGKKKKSKDDGNKKAVAAVQPNNFFSPFGDLSSSRGSTTFTPKHDMTSFNQAGAGLNTLTSDLPTSVSAEDIFDNPFYGSTRDMLQNPIRQEREVSNKSLRDSLTARNQLGSSFDAYSQSLMDREYNGRMDNADLQARQQSSDSYFNSISQLMNLLGSLSNTQAQQMDIATVPAKLATNYQGAVSGLQGAQAQLLQKQPQQQKQGFGLSSALGLLGGLFS